MKALNDKLWVAGQLQTSDFHTAAEMGIAAIINNRPDNEESNQLSHEVAKVLAENLGMTYHYLPMANRQPFPPTLIADFKKVLDETEGQVLAHCRSGTRSSFIWALGQLQAGNITPDQAIESAANAGVNLSNFRQVFEQVI